ncbi:MAG: DEAD/DEAH box helicase family protein [Taibaiella sp.]|nr:DEAD/DEAH box helicase family protein [Taibaiella sp.]
MNFDFKPGSLVTLRNRPWVVLPSEDNDIFLVKPLGGSDDEVTGIFKPLATTADKPKTYNFEKPSARDLSDFRSAKLLYNAARLSFRNAAGPFRCLGKLSFRPRSYQMVPLIMALKQETVRLMISDDVGVGKTIEALLIAKELYERKEIKRFAIVCLPHLCDQWQDELKNKFGIEAVVIRSGSASALERQIRNHENIFRAFPFQIISIDYIKSGNKREVFLDHCPELVIVDEAHTCAKPAGANNSQQQRFHLLNDISNKTDQNLVLLTATPHSGKQEEFQSLLGLLKKRFANIDISTSTEDQRKEIADHFIQRRRADIVIKSIGEETKFPDRNASDNPYALTREYIDLFNDILEYARGIVQGSATNGKQRYGYWDALALLRGVMSSPAAGISMLQKKAAKKKLTEDEDEFDTASGESEAETVMDTDFSAEDNLPTSVIGKSGSDTESKRLLAYAARLQEIADASLTKDNKVKETVAQVKDWLQNRRNPIIFCRYIPTANYLGQICRQYFTGKAYKDLHIEVVTSELNDDLRREKIASMQGDGKRRLLIATDCLSEGINLQDGFNALLHYDLPWNPNRLEQREGRIDRFGQQADSVDITLLYGSNNPIDGVVLDVLLRKAREIRRSIGISIPFPESSASVMEAVMNAVLLKPVPVVDVARQGSLFEAEEIQAEKNKVARAFEEAEKREKASRSIFAKNTIKVSEIEQDLKEVDEAIGDVRTVESFVVEAMRFMGIDVTADKDGYRVFTTNIPQRLRDMLTNKQEINISFKSPTPAGYKYLGRNHPFVEHLSQTIINNALNGMADSAARAAVLRTKDVQEKTVLFQLRVRNVIAEQPSNREIVAEEMWLWGYRGGLASKSFIDKDEAMNLLMNARVSRNMERPEEEYWLNDEMTWVKNDAAFRENTDGVALERATHLVDAHMRFKKLVSGSRFKVVEPILPMDVLGVYILLPQVQ